MSEAKATAVPPKPKPRKGCYNCMKRRITCDRTETHCLKCQKKGLACPGMGVRYRFNDGIAARGKFKGKKAAVVGNEENFAGLKAIGEISERNTILKWVGSGVTINEREAPGEDAALLNTEASQAVTSRPITLETVVIPSWIKSHPYLSTFEEEFLSCGSGFALRPCLEVLNPRARMLFSHFSTHVSPVMVFFDGEENGYRHHVLPFAVSSPLVQRAVSVAAAFHLSKHMPHLRVPAEAGRTAIIKKLNEDAMTSGDEVFSETNRATIILLIVADLVTGSKEVLILYRMFQSFLAGRKGNAPVTPLTEFLDYQCRIIDFFARPVLSESEGITRLSRESQPLIDVFEISAGQRRDTSSQVSLLLSNQAFRRARDIYLLRAQSISGLLDEELMESLISDFKILLLELEPTTEGAHTLVWPYFIVAAESKRTEDREFFYKRLEYIWDTTGYWNVKVAMDALMEIWAQPYVERWTASLLNVATIVM